VPALKAETLTADAAANRRLTAKLSTLKLKMPSGTATSPAAQAAAGKRYTFEKNPQSIESFTLEPTPPAGGVSLAMRIAGTDQRLAVGHNDWKTGTLTTGSSPDAVAASGAWTSIDTYTFTVARYRTPFTTTYQLRFAGDELFVKAEQNVGAADTRIAEYVGKVATSSVRPQ
jgi:hypothetical protein